MEKIYNGKARVERSEENNELEQQDVPEDATASPPPFPHADMSTTEIKTSIKNDHLSMIRTDLSHDDDTMTIVFAMKGRVSGNTLKKTNDSMMAVVKCLHDALRHTLVDGINAMELALTKDCTRDTVSNFSNGIRR